MKLRIPKRLLIIGLIVIALIGFFIIRSQGTRAPQLQFASVKRQDIKSTVSSSGSLTGKDSVNLKFKSSGKLAYINVKAGDSVLAGAVIAGLDTQDLAIALQQAQNTLRDKQATVDKILDDVKDHSADETFTQRQTRTTAQVARDSAFDSVKAAQRAFQDAVIISPIAGLVTQAPPIAGQTVSGSDLIAQVVDTTQIMFDTDVDEADISKISVGQRAEITLDPYGEKIFSGTVSQKLPQTKVTSSGATVVTVRIKLNQPPEDFVNGLTGQASIIIEEAKNVLTVPQEAVRENNTVFIEEGKGIRPKKVTPGIRSDTDVEIKEGLTEKQQVVTNPPASINQTRSNNPLGGVLRLFGGGGGRGR